MPTNTNAAMATSWRRTGLRVLDSILWGTHFCLFYETKEDLFDTVAPYFKAGFESNEFCLWAVSAPLTQEEARIALSQRILGFDHCLAEGRIEIITACEWYRKGEQADPKQITVELHAKLHSALAQGYEGMRISANALWLSTAYWKEFREYEQWLSEALGGGAVIALCTYPLIDSRPIDVFDVVRAHRVTGARRRGRWEIIETAEAPKRTHSLTAREREVMAWVSRGKTTWEIGEILHITKRTVDSHIESARQRLGAATRAQAVAIALGDGLIKAP